MSINNSVFKKNILAFTLSQVILLSFLLVVSVVLRVWLYPHNYLESLPLYFIVGFFFLWEMLDFLLACKEMDASGGQLAAGYFICFFLSAQPSFTAVLFLIFLVAEYVFDAVFYFRVLRK